MSKTYRITGNQTFLEPNGAVKGFGDTIELPDDVAQRHADSLTPLDTPASQKIAPASPQTDAVDISP